VNQQDMDGSGELSRPARPDADDDLRCPAKARRERSTNVAQKVQMLFLDDIDGSEAEGTVRFGLDGTDYEIDLSTQHAAALRNSLAGYIKVARRAPRARGRQPASGSEGRSRSRGESTEIREWAKSQGIEVKERGRIPSDLMVKFKAAAG
jgi:Lsr2